MGPPPIPVSERTRSSRRWVIPTILVAVVLVPLLSGLIWYVTYRMRNTAAIRKLEAKAKQRGEPLNLEDLAAMYPPVPDAENAAIRLIEIWKEEEPGRWQGFLEGRRPLPQPAVHKLDPALPILGSKAARPSRVEPLSASALAKAETYLKSRAPHMEAVRAALHLPRCRFPVRIADGADALVPQLPAMKAEAQQFHLEALVATERGDFQTGINAITNVARTGNLLASGPFLIDQIVRIACLNMAIESVEHLISRQDLTVFQLARLEAMLNDLRMPGSLRSSYISDRAECLHVFDLPVDQVKRFGSAGDETEDSLDLAAYYAGFRFLKVTGLSSADRRLVLEAFEEAIDLADKDTPAARFRCRQVFADAGDAARRFPPKVISGLLLPGIQNAAVRFAAHEARRRSAVTAIAVQKYRLARNGTLPERLDALVPEFLPSVPLDPFDGKPLRYRRLATGFVVYSIGADYHDNEGRERPQKGAAGEFDETFIIER